MQPTRFIRSSRLVLLLATSWSCARHAVVRSPEVSPMQTQLSAEERAAGWRPLFDGQSTNGWRAYRSQTMPTGWRVTDGTLTKEQPTEDILTKDQFGDFELALDWKIGTGGNAGIFYRATEEYD